MAEQLEQSLIPPEADESSSSKPSSSSNNNPPAPSSKTESTSSVTAVDTSSSGGGNNNKGDDDDNDDDMLLVTEFPPPPYYYTLASRHTPANQKLTPPPIPHRAFKVAAKRVMNERKKAREESDRIRLDAEGEGGGEGIEAMDVDKEEKEAGESSSSTKKHLTEEEEEDDDDSIDPNNPNEPVVAVFGEIVEDPTLTVEEECHDPIEIRENVKKLNRSVLNGFLKLVQQLVHDPNDNKKLRDELSHNLFLMLQECNKFREHQAREILIETLEQQLERRKEGLSFLNKQINEADDALAALQKFKDTS